jgi:hypothetical protein
LTGLIRAVIIREQVTISFGGAMGYVHSKLGMALGAAMLAAALAAAPASAAPLNFTFSFTNG